MSVPLPLILRDKQRRWLELKRLLTKVEMLVSVNQHIDSLDTRIDRIRDAEVLVFDSQLADVRAAIQQEVTKLTVDGLTADLREKRKHEVTR